MLSPLPPCAQTVASYLRDIKDPLSKSSIIKTELVEDVSVEKDQIIITLRIPPDLRASYEVLRQTIAARISEIYKTYKVSVIMTSHQKAAPILDTLKPSTPKLEFPQIQHIIAIASGKGGVGKSLAAFNIALGLQRLGKKVGILDADIYGPSLPQMLGLREKPAFTPDKRFAPLVKFGLQCMSIGFLVPEEAPLIWRGPMIQTSVLQLLKDVAWKDLDILVIDLPPGTGDTQLTLIQKVPLTGAVIVSTPQDLALIDARKAIKMFQKLQIPILGVIENMSYFSCPTCGHRAEIFHHGGACEYAKKLNVSFLGEIPLNIELRQACDQGLPLIETAPSHPISTLLLNISQRVKDEIDNQG
jgi:ATP-binding protein involved in chromosome partitioning